MAVTAAQFGQFALHLLNGDVDVTVDTIKCALLTSSATINQDTNDYWNDISANEVTGTGYTAGGATLASKTVTYDDATNRTKFDAADITWAASTITARYAVFYKDTGVASTSPLISYVDFGTDVSSVSSTFTIQLDALGIVGFTASVAA